MNYPIAMHAWLFANLVLPLWINGMEQNASTQQTTRLSTTLVLQHTTANEVQTLLASYVQFLSLQLTVVNEDTLQISGTSNQHHTIDQLTNLILTFIDRDGATLSHQSTNNMKFSALTPFF